MNTLQLETTELAFVELQLGQSLQTGNLVKTHVNSSARVDISIQNFTRVSRTAPETVWKLGSFALNGEEVIRYSQVTRDTSRQLLHVPMRHESLRHGTVTAHEVVEFDMRSSHRSPPDHPLPRAAPPPTACSLLSPPP